VVPPLLLNQEAVPEERKHDVRFGIGARVEPQLDEVFEKRFGLPLIGVWGMTETGRIYADCYGPRRPRTRAFGRPFGGFEARVVDDKDREVARGTDGELLVRFAGRDPRKGFFAGYLKNPEATEEAWRGGWFHTGDVVRQSEDGMLHFVDRKKNIIRRSGENIAAAEVEACLQAHDAVAQVAVLAAPDEIREEEVLACVVPMAGVTPGAALAARFLVDAGSGVGAQLVRAGIRPYDWPRVLITHHHSDHTIDLGHLLITRWIVGQNAPLEVWGPAGTRRQIEKLLDYLGWDVEV